MRLLLPLAAVAWACAVGPGFWALARHEFTPGPPAHPPRQWPTACGITPAADRATLLVFAHPRCPCTRATLGELDVLLAQAAQPVDVRVLFYRPSGESPAWSRTDQWTSAARMPGVAVMEDIDGQMAAFFSAVTSGETLLYGADGVLQFHGGITPSRGHRGDNPGRSAIAALLADGVPAAREAPAFGCPLLTGDQGDR